VSVYTYPSAEVKDNKKKNGTTMSVRQNTLVCAFDQNSSRITAYDIPEWTYDTMCLRESEVAMIQIDGSRRQV